MDFDFSDVIEAGDQTDSTDVINTDGRMNVDDIVPEMAIEGNNANNGCNDTDGEVDNDAEQDDDDDDDDNETSRRSDKNDILFGVASSPPHLISFVYALQV